MYIINCKLQTPGGPIPQNMARALMPRQPYSVAVPSTGGRFSPSLLRFLSPGNGGTEGGVKTIEEGWGESGAFLKGKEGRVGFRKKLFFHNHFKCLEDKLDVIPEAGILYILQIEFNLLLHDYMDVIILRISSLLH